MAEFFGSVPEIFKIWASQLLLFLGKLAPRGGWRLVRLAARSSVDLQSIPTIIDGLAIPIFLDLRDPSCIPYYLTGNSGGNRKIRKVLPEIVRAGDVYFDIGANFGTVAAAVLPNLGDQGSMVVVEANPSVARNLGRTFHSMEQVTVCASAVSETEGELAFYVSEKSALSSLHENPAHVKIVVPSTSIDTLVNRFGAPNVLKVDVEGAEETVFRSARQLLGSARCPIIFFEALSDGELAASIDLIRALHGGAGKFYHVAHGGRLVFLDHPKVSSDYVYVPDNFSERVVSLLPAR